MKKITITLFTLLSLSSCLKDKNYKYSYRLSAAPKSTGIFQKLPYTLTSFITTSQNNLQLLNRETLDRWNGKDSEKIYQIDTSWIEEVKCMGCKPYWE